MANICNSSISFIANKIQRVFTSKQKDFNVDELDKKQHGDQLYIFQPPPKNNKCKVVIDELDKERHGGQLFKAIFNIEKKNNKRYSSNTRTFLQLNKNPQ